MLNKLNSNNLNAFKCNLKELSTKSALNAVGQRSVACACPGVFACGHQNFCCLFSCSPCWLIAFLIFLTAAMKFSCFSSNDIGLLCF